MSQEPSIEDAFAWLSAGMVAPDPELQLGRALKSEDYDYRARCMREAFRGEAGEVALETILKISLFRAPVDHRLPTETEYLRHAQLRQGQNQIASAILAYIRHAEKLDKEPDHAPAPISTDEPPDLEPGRYGGSRDADWWADDGPGVAVTG